LPAALRAHRLHPAPALLQVKGLEEQLAAASSKLGEAGAELKRMQAAAVNQIQQLNEQLAAAKAEAGAAAKVRACPCPWRCGGSGADEGPQLSPARGWQRGWQRGTATSAGRARPAT
jgi:hypothetical protein